MELKSHSINATSHVDILHYKPIGKNMMFFTIFELIIMPQALLCMKTNVASAKNVLKELKTFMELKEVFTVIGEYDIIAKVEAKTFADLVTLDQNIKNLGGVREILSMLLIDSKESVREKENGILIG